MAVVWTLEAEAMLIEKVRDCLPLWNTKHPSYLKKLLKKHLYVEIALVLKEEFPFIAGITGGMSTIPFICL